MKVIGGSLGTTGEAVIGGQRLFIKVPSGKRKYNADEIALMNAEVVKKKEFSAGSFVLGAIILGGLGLVVLGPIGAAVGLLLSVLGSWRKSSDQIAHVEFSDGERITLSCTPRAIKKLFKLRS